MKLEDFVEQIMNRYPRKDRESDSERAQFRKDVTDIADAIGDGAGLDTLSHKIRRDWTRQGRPPIGLLWEWGEEIKPGSSAFKDSSGYTFRCQECKTLLSEYAGCPKCGKLTGVDAVVLSENHGPVMRVRPDCYRCLKFDLSRGRRGPDCNRWGHHDAGDICRDCACAACCAMEKRWRADPVGMTNATKEGRLSLERNYPWIRQETQ